ncbi:hypothetical protein CCACVL1_13387 [Corchorus capsularis]|uniref:Uncharacterized protein n=1 Tax=Corchorus capsularis TaxID=210143 RepID=A0A1R3IBA0_COCAP|nr:hypothetical protein CCACVL1_13387 [Corchorus capsularis]
MSPKRQARVQAPKSKILKGKRARFYIIRRCVFMLLCWRDHGDENHRAGCRERGKMTGRLVTKEEHSPKKETIRAKDIDKQRGFHTRNPTNGSVIPDRAFYNRGLPFPSNDPASPGSSTVRAPFPPSAMLPRRRLTTLRARGVFARRSLASSAILPAGCMGGLSLAAAFC